MAHTIIGTAGHIDHGKTLLVKALTGTDTDQAPEEKTRGITIELGFAFLGEDATIIDVPGHERFVKTMVAGVSTIDLALLVIAADDGVMPQSREHLDVLELLGVQRGAVALNKIDLVEEEWLDLVEEEVLELVQGTFLEGADLFRVSALTGDGIEALKARLEEMIVETAEKRAATPFRLPVDRAFLVKGFGLVCTGTVLGGELGEGDSVEVQPAGRAGRVRGLQQHGQTVSRVKAGDRAAINLSGVEHGQVERGDVLAGPGCFQPTYMLDARLRLLSSSPGELVQRARVRLHLGTAEIMARAVLLDREVLKPGEEALVQLRLESPTVAVWGDRFVIRRYSPALTIGGGRVLEPHPRKYRRRDPVALGYLEELEEEDVEQVAAARLRQVRSRLKPAGELVGDLGLGPERVEEVLARLEAAGQVERVTVDNQVCALHAAVRQELEERIEAELRGFHAEQPLKPGLRREELRNRSARHVQPELFDHLLGHLERQKRVAVTGSVVRAGTHRICFTAAEEELREAIETRVKTRDFAAIPDADSLARQLRGEEDRVEGVLGALQSLGTVVALEGGLLVHAEVLEEVRRELRGYLEPEGEITVSRFRELIGSNRKYALALLALFDGEGFTERQGDVRVLRP